MKVRKVQTGKKATKKMTISDLRNLFDGASEDHVENSKTPEAPQTKETLGEASDFSDNRKNFEVIPVTDGSLLPENKKLNTKTPTLEGSKIFSSQPTPELKGKEGVLDGKIKFQKAPELPNLPDPVAKIGFTQFPTKEINRMDKVNSIPDSYNEFAKVDSMQGERGLRDTFIQKDPDNALSNKSDSGIKKLQSARDTRNTIIQQSNTASLMGNLATSDVSQQYASGDLGPESLLSGHRNVKQKVDTSQPISKGKNDFGNTKNKSTSDTDPGKISNQMSNSNYTPESYANVQGVGEAKTESPTFSFDDPSSNFTSLADQVKGSIVNNKMSGKDVISNTSSPLQTTKAQQTSNVSDIQSKVSDNPGLINTTRLANP